MTNPTGGKRAFHQEQRILLETGRYSEQLATGEQVLSAEEEPLTPKLVGELPLRPSAGMEEREVGRVRVAMLGGVRGRHCNTTIAIVLMRHRFEIY